MSRRPVAMGLYALVLIAWSLTIGIPNDTVGVTLWLWLGVAAWDPTRWRDFPRDWWRPILILIGYWFLRGLADDANRLVGRPVVVEAPIRFDRWVASWFGGSGTPTEILQRHWCAWPSGVETCTRDLAPHWWDVVFTTVYASHFVTALTLAAVLWVRSREVWVRWMRRFVAINLAGLAIYWLCPMAPPWMASRDGDLGPVARITGRGWSEIDLHRQTMVLFGMGDKVAAMPSLHAGISFLVAFFLITRLRSAARWLLLLYPIAMSTTLMYSGEHYLLDVLCGGLLALAVMIGCARWERERPARAPREASQGPMTGQ